MPKTRQQKKEVLKQLVDCIKGCKSLVVTDYTGLNVADSEELRGKCRAEDVEFLAVKKTLLRKALDEAGYDAGNLDLEGSIAVAFSHDDEVAPAKILHEFSKEHEQLQLRGGVLEGNIVGLEKVQAFAVLPSKPELYAKVVGSLNAPVSGFVNVLAGNVRGLVNVLNAIKDTK